MKKIFILLILLSFLFPLAISAQTVTLPMPSLTPTPILEPTSVNYDLPYPGILPGSPLYVFKSLRDKVLELVTVDPAKKSEFFLLQSDKFLSSSLLLFKEGDTKLGEESLNKSQDSLEKAVEALILAKKSEKNINDMPSKIKTSAAKQKQEITNISENSTADKKDSFGQYLNKIKQIENRANSLDK
jgi:hypothetical protein